MRMSEVLLANVLALAFVSTASASTVALLESSQTITNTTTTDQTFNFVSTLPVSSLTGLHEETGTTSFSLLDGDGSGGASIVINQWHGLVNPLAGTPIFDLSLLLGESFTCSGVFECSTDTVITSTASQLHSDVDHGGNSIDSIGIHLNFTLSPGDTAIFDSSWKVSPVPVPAAIWLLSSGLIGLIGFARRKK